MYSLLVKDLRFSPFLVLKSSSRLETLCKSLPPTTDGFRLEPGVFSGSLSERISLVAMLGNVSQQATKSEKVEKEVCTTAGAKFAGGWY